MGQPHFFPDVGRRAADHTNRRSTASVSPRAPMRPPEGRRSPWSDAEAESADAQPDLTAPFLDTVLARVAANLCGPDRDDPQA